VKGYEMESLLAYTNQVPNDNFNMVQMGCGSDLSKRSILHNRAEVCIIKLGFLFSKLTNNVCIMWLCDVKTIYTMLKRLVFTCKKLLYAGFRFDV